MTMRQATLLDSRLCAPHTRHFRFRVEGPERFEFLPGQFVVLAPDPDNPARSRPYSIASPPRGDNLLEFCLNRVQDGPLTRELFEMEAGAEVALTGPQGGFVLRPQPRDALFVATGTGIAPIRSMLHHLFATGSRPRAWLLFGVRHESGILYRAEFEQMARESEGFEFVPTLSRPGTDWAGATGYVQEHIARLLAGRTDVDTYLCGLRTMVNEVDTLLRRIGFGDGSILYEKYD